MMTETACFLMTGKAAFACRVFPTHFYANISEMRYFRQIRLWKRRYSERTPTGAFPAALPLSGVGTEKKYCEKCAEIAYKKQQAEYARKKRTESKNRG